MSDLTAKRRRFVLEYLIDSNATQAAIRAGYKPKTAKQQGSWLLRNVEEVAAAVAEAQAKKAAELDLDHEWVLRRLIENVERSMQAEPVLDRDDNPTGEYVYQGAVANRALEPLGKHLKLFDGDGVVEHHHEHDQRHTVTHKTADEVADEVEEMFRGPPRLPPTLVPTKH